MILFDIVQDRIDRVSPETWDRLIYEIPDKFLEKKVDNPEKKVYN